MTKNRAGATHPKNLEEIISLSRHSSKTQRPLHSSHRSPSLCAMHDARVNQITPKLFAKASTPEQMIALTPKEIENIIRPCGLAPPNRRPFGIYPNFYSPAITEKFPKTLDALEALPGVGHKTASVVLIQAFNIPAFPVDTHIHRCAHRWKLSSGKTVAQTEKDLKKLFPKTPGAQSICKSSSTPSILPR